MSGISVIMGYNNRPQQLENTLRTIEHFCADILEDVDLVVIDDSSEDHLRAESCLGDYKGPYQHVYLDRRNQQYRNPGSVYNMAAEMAKSDLLFLTNPENMHCGPVLQAGMVEYEVGSYAVFGCRTLRMIPTSWRRVIENPDAFTNWQEAHGWYQHSRIYNRLLHFAAFIDKETYSKVGGFDENYDHGVGFEDNDFIEEIIRNEVPITVVDEPFVAHQPHGRPRVNDGWYRNEKMFKEKWGYDPRDFTER